MNYYIQTFGCQMNVDDSRAMEEYLLSHGCVPVSAPAAADMVIVNTCAVRDHAEHKAASFLGRVSILKETRPDMRIVVAGCMAERVKQGIRRRFPAVDLIIGSTQIEYAPQMLAPLLSPPGAGAPAIAPSTDRPRVSEFVTIMRGCDNHCAYCIVPTVRGPESSRPVNDVLRDIGERLARGAREIILLGQNVNSYRSPEPAGPPADFAALLRNVAALPDVHRIRFMTNHPKDLSDPLIHAIAGCPKVCEHIHLPLQSGSDAILAAMNRRYTADHYCRLVDRLRAAIPGIAITTDILVGFPGETDADFAQTLRVMQYADYDSLFVFKYSPRPGTPAAARGDAIPPDVKAERLAIVLERSHGNAARKNATLIGTIQEVLIEGTFGGNGVWGRTRTNKKVHAAGDPGLTGTTVRISITDHTVNTLQGNILT